MKLHEGLTYLDFMKTSNKGEIVRRQAIFRELYLSAQRVDRILIIMFSSANYTFEIHGMSKDISFYFEKTHICFEISKTSSYFSKARFPEYSDALCRGINGIVHQ